MQCNWQLLTKIGIRAQVEPAVESASSVVGDPTRLARCGFFAVTDRGELWAPDATAVCVATTSRLQLLAWTYY